MPARTQARTVLSQALIKCAVFGWQGGKSGHKVVLTAQVVRQAKRECVLRQKLPHLHAE